MHVAILGPSHPWRGGIAHHTASLFGALERGGHTVELLNFRRLYPKLLFPGKTQLDESADAFSVPAEAVFDPLSPTSWLSAARRLVARRPERLILQWWHPFFAPGYAAVAAAARLAGCEVVMMCHNVEPHESTPVDRTLLRLAYTLPHRFVVQSAIEKERLETLIGTGRGVQVAAHPRYDIFSKASKVPTREQARQRCGVDAEHMLLFFGLVRPYKGLDILLEACARLPNSLDWQLIVAGEVYGNAQAYHRQISSLGLTERVTLDNRYLPNEEVPVLFEAADVCVLPYRKATGSGAANVALACETPLIMSRIDSLVQAFADEPVEWFEPEDVDGLRDAIVQVLERPTARGHATKTSEPARDGWQQLVDALVDSP